MKKIFLVIILLILLFPAVQKECQPISSMGLKGYFQHAVAPEFTWKTWFTGVFQDQAKQYIEDSIGFKSDFVRLFNQINFTLFSISGGHGITIGKDGYIFFEEGIMNYSGANNLGTQYIESKVKKLKAIQDALWEKYHIPLVFIIAPDKAHFFPEYIPDRYLRNPKKLTNYAMYVRAFNRHGVDYIDFNDYFLRMKDTATWPLYPKNGSHWSDYAAALAFDSLQSYLTAKKGWIMPVRIRDTVSLTQASLHDDNDLIRTTNLIWDPGHPRMAFEKYHFQQRSGQLKPRVLFIGDSYYWQWFNQGLPDSVFENVHYWYYNEEVFPESWTKATNAWDLLFEEAVLKQHAIVVIQSMGGSCKLGYGFVDRAFSEILMGESRIKFFEYLIRHSPKWLAEVERKAREWNMDVNKVIRRDAEYMVFREMERDKKKN